MTSGLGVLAYDPNEVKPGWIAFFIVMILVVATFLLWRSMNTQLGKIKVPPRASFRGTSGSSTGPDGQAVPPATSTQPPAGPDDQQ